MSKNFGRHKNTAGANLMEFGTGFFFYFCAVDVSVDTPRLVFLIYFHFIFIYFEKEKEEGKNISLFCVAVGVCDRYDSIAKRLGRSVL